MNSYNYTKEIMQSIKYISKFLQYYNNKQKRHILTYLGGGDFSGQGINLEVFSWSEKITSYINKR